MIERIIQSFWDNSIQNGKSFLTGDISDKIKRAISLIQVFYLFVFFLSVCTFSPYSQFPRWQVLMQSESMLEPLWNLFWIKYFDWDIVVRLSLIFYFISSILALVFWKKSIVIRALVFISMFCYLALISSFGKIDHWMHLATISAFLLVFIPKIDIDNSKNEEVLKVVFGIQFFILITYTISGFFKFWGILKQEISGSISAINPSGFGELVGLNSYQHNSEYFFTSFILNNQSFLITCFLLSGYFVELFSIKVLFRPNYHRIWGLLLILMHANILLTVGPDFSIHMMVVGIFIFLSPFSEKFDLIAELKWIFKKIKKSISPSEISKDIIIFYDGNCLTCNHFLNFISKYDIPEQTRISTQESEKFNELLKENPDLKNLDTLIIVENFPNSPSIIRVKADAVTWFLLKIRIIFLPIRYLYLLFSITGNLVYDVVAKNRKKSISGACPIPPEKLRKLL